MKNSPDSRRLDDGGEGLMKINPRSLREAAEHPSCFAPFKRTVGVELVLEDPFACDDISTPLT